MSIFRFILILLYCLFTMTLQAQKFSVETFRVLPTDVSASINPVRDNNGEECALLKVIGTEDFAFSTPLGIVKRVDNTGEIWLYLPAGSKKITIKHPEWGVMRDFHFTTPLATRVCYELRINQPIQTPKIKEVITTITDTLVLTRIDTLRIKEKQPPLPMNVDIEATLAFGGQLKSTLGGIMITIMKSHGVFLHALSNFTTPVKVIGDCDRIGMVNNHLPFYSGLSRRSVLLTNVGAAHRLSDRISIYEGLGYGWSRLDWELAPSEGGGFLRNRDRSMQGVTFEAGCHINFGRFSTAISAITLQGREWFGAIGIGYRFGKQNRNLYN